MKLFSKEFVTEYRANHTKIREQAAKFGTKVMDAGGEILSPVEHLYRDRLDVVVWYKAKNKVFSS